MAFSDCPECWNTPCECGHEYTTWDKQRLKDFIQTLSKVLERIEKNEDNKRLKNPLE